LEEIIQKERPCGIIVSMGGQTALNVGIELWQSGVLGKYNCRVLGTPIDVIIATEDREIFSQVRDIFMFIWPSVVIMVMAIRPICVEIKGNR
jgi:carbamoyl-phosphate synthase large subunit